MEPEANNNNNNNNATDASDIDDGVSFSHVSAVVTGWTVDFLFLTLCRRFKEGDLDEFNKTVSSYEAMCQSKSMRRHLQGEKVKICGFLSRVMHGKHLDVQFEEDPHVMPLMSAAQIWSDLEDTVADESLFKNITILLLVQSVAVCFEKGQTSSASSALKWFENNHEFPKNLGVKLKTVVRQKETYHPLLMSFSFSRLRENIQSFLDSYLEKNPSDYLIKEATKWVQSSENGEGLEDTMALSSSLSETTNESAEGGKKKESTACLRKKRKLLSTQNIDAWKPESRKKPTVSLRRLSRIELSQMTSERAASATTKKQKPVEKARKGHRKWTPELDQYLIKGVKRHGHGKWARILLDYDFEGRSGTMLKDRWRVLLRTNVVS